MDSKEKLKELNVLNAIMLVAILIGIGIGIITRLIYLRKKYKDINPK